MTARIALFFASAVLLVAGCGSSEGDSSHPNYAMALAGAPRPLASLHAQGNELLDGDLDAFERRIDSLRGYPVVVNVWASWCGPCRFEFPHFQRAAAKYGKRIAFLGVDSQDADEEAMRFLEEEPVPYPSYRDPDEEIANELGAIGLPATAFYDRQGELVYLHHKPFVEEGEIEAYIEHYALGGERKGG